MNTPLSFLSSHFEAIAPRAVEIEGLPFKLIFEPMNAEQTIAYVRATNARSAREQANGYAELLMQTVKLESGELAFPLVKGQPNPLEVLTKKTDPVLFAALVRNLGLKTNTAEVEEVEKKSPAPEQDGSSASTSSPTEPADPSPT